MNTRSQARNNDTLPQIMANAYNIAPFNGSQADARRFIQQFTALCILNKAKDDDIKHLFTVNVQWDASVWAETLSDKDTESLRAITSAFNDRFVNQQGATLYSLQEYGQRRHTPPESINAYIDVMVRQGGLLNKSEDDIKNQIIMGLPEHVYNVVLLKEPKNIEEVRKAANAASLWKFPPVIGYTTPAGSEPVKTADNSVVTETILDKFGALLTRLEDIERRQHTPPKRYFNQRDQPTWQRSQPIPQQQSYQRNQGQGQQRFRNQQQDNRQSNRPRTGNSSCMNCGMSNHFTNNCFRCTNCKLTKQKCRCSH